MKKNWLRIVVFGVLACSTVAALTLLPGEAPAVSTVETILADPPVMDLVAAGGKISCTFKCNDGIGYYLPSCGEGSLNACCGLAQPACENNEGLESGICRQGRLGLPCQPFDF